MPPGPQGAMSHIPARSAAPPLGCWRSLFFRISSSSTAVQRQFCSARIPRTSSRPPVAAENCFLCPLSLRRPSSAACPQRGRRRIIMRALFYSLLSLATIAATVVADAPPAAKHAGKPKDSDDDDWEDIKE